MQFPDPLIPGRLQRRYKRFLSDILLEDGSEVVAHCANPGSMMGLAEPGSPVWLSPSRNPARKLKYSWELVEVAGDKGTALVGINTGRANGLVAEALEAGKVPELAGYAGRRAEVRYGTNSRVDFLLEEPGRPACYVEVKSVTLRRTRTLAEFPDAVTARGAKHLGELAEVARQGQRAVLFFLVQRGDCTTVAPAADIDPAYATALRRSLDAGVEVLCYKCNLSPHGIALDERLPLTL
ncbi:MAG: DNA/RNA nuclease SfsA [Kiloniellaceae bacterium]